MEALAKLNVILNYKGKEVKRIIVIQKADWMTEQFSGVVTTPEDKATGKWVYDTYYERCNTASGIRRATILCP